MRAQRIIVSEFGTLAHPDPCKSIFNRYFSYYFPSQMTDNALVNFVECGDEIYAATEVPILTRIDKQTLDVIQRVAVGKLYSVNTLTAHPHYDTEGNAYNMGTGNRTYNIVTIPKPKPTEDKDANTSALDSGRIAASIPISHGLSPSYYHSFGMSENYIVFPEMPLRLYLPKLLTANFRNQPFSESMQWNPNDKTRIHLSDLRTKTVVPQVYTSDAWFTFHHANAFEQDNCVVADFCGYRDASFVKQFTVDTARQGEVKSLANPELWRIVMPLEIPEDSKPGEDLLPNHSLKTKAKAILQPDRSIHVMPEKIGKIGFEFPRINYQQCNGRNYKFVYGANLFGDDTAPASVCKTDVTNGSQLSWAVENSQQTPGEPVFVPRPEATEEDDGVVLVPITNNNPTEKHFLLILDAQNFVELARASVDATIPFAFHAHYLPE